MLVVSLFLLVGASSVVGLGVYSYPDSETGDACFDLEDNDLDGYVWDGTNYSQNPGTGADCADPDCLGGLRPNVGRSRLLAANYLRRSRHETHAASFARRSLYLASLV